MADDIDELLDEIESKFLSISNNKKTPKFPPKPGTFEDDELRAAMADILGVSEPLVLEQETPKQNQTGQKRCFPLILTGSQNLTDVGSAFNSKACDNLRCTDCDFKVACFNNFEWSPNTDYLFLRNNMPDFERLKKNLIPKSGIRAYACQCRCKSVDKPVDLKIESSLKWVCGKH